MEHWCSPISSDHVWDLRMEMHGFAVMELDIWKWLVNQHWVILSNITCCKATPNTIGFPTANHGGGASAHWLTGFSAAFLTRASVPCFRCQMPGNNSPWNLEFSFWAERLCRDNVVIFSTEPRSDNERIPKSRCRSRASLILSKGGVFFIWCSIVIPNFFSFVCTIFCFG